jgi:hypothetical protein
MNDWLLLVLNLPGPNQTLRIRVWRELKVMGAASLRDGVYLLPAREPWRTALAAVADEVIAAGGSARVPAVAPGEDEEFVALFDRAADYGALLGEITALRESLTPLAAQDAQKQARKLRRSLAEVAEIDFFPGEAARQTGKALQQLEIAVSRILNPDEPHSIHTDVIPLRSEDHQGCVSERLEGCHGGAAPLDSSSDVTLASVGPSFRVCPALTLPRIGALISSPESEAPLCR